MLAVSSCHSAARRIAELSLHSFRRRISCPQEIAWADGTHHALGSPHFALDRIRHQAILFVRIVTELKLSPSPSLRLRSPSILTSTSLSTSFTRRQAGGQGEHGYKKALGRRGSDQGPEGRAKLGDGLPACPKAGNKHRTGQGAAVQNLKCVAELQTGRGHTI